MVLEDLGGDRAGAKDFDLLIFDFDEGGRWVVKVASVFDVGNMLEEFGRKLAGVGDRRFAGEVGTGGDKRVP